MTAPGGRQLTLRPLAIADIEAVAGVHYRACLTAYRFMNWSYPLTQVETFCREKFGEWTWTLGGFNGDALLSFIALRERHVDQLYVDPISQRAGVGSALLHAALEAWPGRITLDVFEENAPARAFYEKHGFEARDRWMNEQEGAIDLLYVRE